MTRPRARLIAFFALVSFGALQWIRLLDPGARRADDLVPARRRRGRDRPALVQPPRAPPALGRDRRHRLPARARRAAPGGHPLLARRAARLGRSRVRPQPGHRDAPVDAHPVPGRGALGARHARLHRVPARRAGDGARLPAARRRAPRPAARRRGRRRRARRACRRSRWRAARPCSSASSSRRCSSPTCASTASGATRWSGRARPSPASCSWPSCWRRASTRTARSSTTRRSRPRCPRRTARASTGRTATAR